MLSCPICLSRRAPAEYLDPTSPEDQDLDCFAALECGHVGHEVCLRMIRAARNRKKASKDCPTCKRRSSRLYRLYLPFASSSGLGSSSPPPARPPPPPRRQTRIADDDDQDEDDGVVEEDEETTRRRMLAELRGTITDLKSQNKETSTRLDRTLKDKDELKMQLGESKRRVAELHNQVKATQQQQARMDSLRREVGTKDRQIDELRRGKVSKEQALLKANEKHDALLASVESIHAAYEREAKDLKAQNADWKQQLKDLKTDNQRLRGANDTWKEKYEALKSSSAASKEKDAEPNLRKRSSDHLSPRSNAKRVPMPRHGPLSSTVTASGFRVKDHVAEAAERAQSRHQSSLYDPGFGLGVQSSSTVMSDKKKGKQPAPPPATIHPDDGDEEEEEDSIMLVKDSRHRDPARSSPAPGAIIVDDPDPSIDSQVDIDNEFSFLNFNAEPASRRSFPTPAAPKPVQKTGPTFSSRGKTSLGQLKIVAGGKGLATGPKHKKKLRV